jgi:hypothetical protein
MTNFREVDLQVDEDASFSNLQAYGFGSSSRGCPWSILVLLSVGAVAVGISIPLAAVEFQQRKAGLK